MADAPLSRAAFDQLLDDLRAVADGYIHGDPTFTDLDVVEGYGLVTSLLSGAIEHRLASDPDRPVFTPIVSPLRKFLGDNADALYQWTRIRGDGCYRVRGRMIGETYLSFTVHGVDPAGGAGQAVLADVNDRDLAIASDGSYELTFGPGSDPPGRGTPGSNHVTLQPTAESLLTRHYFSRPVNVAADPSVRPELTIEPLHDPGPPPPATDEEMADRLRAVGRFVRAETVDRPLPEEMGPIPFVSREPNLLPAPARFSDAALATVGAVDIWYAMAPFVLGPDDALVMGGILPDGPFSNVMLWNRHMQTLDYRHRTTCLNDTQLLLDDQRRFRVVAAPRDPGVPNWLDTEGRSIGLIFWRFLLPESTPQRATCEVVRIDDL
ncbi:MAG TPA: hypothetical protein VGA13_13085 [Acidimicrobiales bacterium]